MNVHRIVGIALLVGAAGVVGCASRSDGAASQRSAVTPTVVSGNVASCADVTGGAGLIGFKLEPVSGGTFLSSDGKLSVTITLTANNTFTFAASGAAGGVDIVAVKGGTDSNVYRYDPESTGDTGLMAPEGKGLSHLLFCYDIETDAGPQDTGPQDTGPMDSGPMDSGPMDSGPMDSGPMDTGTQDTGMPDTTPPPDTRPPPCNPEEDPEC